MNVPKLRFKEFNDEWKEQKFKEFTYYSGKRNKENLNLVSYAITNNFGFIPQSLAHNEFGYMKNTDKRAYNIVTPFSFAYNPARINVGSIGYYNGKKNIIVSSLYEVFKTKEYIDDKFLWYWLKSDIFPIWINRLQEGSVRQYFHYDKLCEVSLYYPTFIEQTKIAQFLLLLDKKIELQVKKIEALKLFKSYTKSEIFKNGNHVYKLGAILNKWNKKNKDGAINYVESISNKAGFIPQSEQFEDRNVASKNLRNYYVIKKGVFGYNPSRLNVGSLALKENDFISVVSPLYECFTTTQNNTYLFEWFNSNNFKKETFSKFEGGVRNTLNFNNLCDIPINLPDIETQNQYAKYFNKINFKISLEEQKLSKLLKYKKALLQDMFI